MINAAPLGMGLLSSNSPPNWHPAPAHLKDACRAAAEHCQQRGVPIERLAIQFSIANRDIATTVVGTASPDEMRQNMAWAQQPPDEQLLREVLAILKPLKDITWQSGRAENNQELTE